jgi:hypothetical protein
MLLFGQTGLLLKSKQVALQLSSFLLVIGTQLGLDACTFCMRDIKACSTTHDSLLKLDNPLPQGVVLHDPVVSQQVPEPALAVNVHWASVKLPGSGPFNFDLFSKSFNFLPEMNLRRSVVVDSHSHKKHHQNNHKDMLSVLCLFRAEHPFKLTNKIYDSPGSKEISSSAGTKEHPASGITPVVLVEQSADIFEPPLLSELAQFGNIVPMQAIELDDCLNLFLLLL